MAITSLCPQCQRQLRVPEDLLGRMVKCPSCAATFTATGGEPPAPPPTFEEPGGPPPGPGPGEQPPPWEEEEIPRRRRMHFPPHRGQTILTLGIISIVSGALGLPTACCICFGLPAVVGLGLGLTAWLMGQGDLKKIDEGRLDPMGRGSTQNGRVCGIIGTAIGGLGLVCGVGSFVVGLVMNVANHGGGGGFNR